MAGPYPHDDHVSGAGPSDLGPHQAQRYPGPPAFSGPRFGEHPSRVQLNSDSAAIPSAYPGMLPPPVQYPSRRRWPLVATAVLAVALLAAGVVAAAIVAAGHDGNAGANTPLTPAAAKTAIQDYLTALSNGDAKKVARHTLCGMYDAIRDHRADMALAELSSSAFRKQFDSADVTSIDKMVIWSPRQTQVLFTVRVVPAAGGPGGNPAPSEDDQAIAQVLTQDNEVLVCSYLLRTGSLY